MKIAPGGGRRRRKTSSYAGNAKKTSRFTTHCHCPPSRPFITPAVHKEQTESHQKSFLNPHLHQSLFNNKQSTLEVSKAFRKPVLPDAKSTNNNPPIPSNIGPRSTLTKPTKPIPTPTKQKWVLCGLKASAASTLVRHPLPWKHNAMLCGGLDEGASQLHHMRALHLRQNIHTSAVPRTAKLTCLTGGGVIVDKHGARRAPFRFSFKGLNCFK